MREGYKEDRAFLNGIRSVLESDATVDRRCLAAIQLAARHEYDLRTSESLHARESVRFVLKAVASLLILAGFSCLVFKTYTHTIIPTKTRQTIAFIGEADADENFETDLSEVLTDADQLLALQDAPYYEVVARTIESEDVDTLEF